MLVVKRANEYYWNQCANTAASTSLSNAASFDCIIMGEGSFAVKYFQHLVVQI